MTQSTDEAWEAWATQDPYYGVLTDPKFRSAALDESGLEQFFGSGEAHVAQVMDICRQRLDPGFAPRSVLDFGCGVGRLVIPFAARAPEVTGVDVSPTMLSEARRNCDSRGAPQARLVLSDDALSLAPGPFDLVHTCIVLQHVEIARGRELVARLIERVAPGGCGAIHVTFAWDLHAATYGRPPPPAPPVVEHGLRRALKDALKGPLRALGLYRDPPPPPEPVNTDPEMQMNFYDLSELFFLLQRAGIERVHTELTDHGGALGAFMYFQRPRA